MGERGLVGWESEITEIQSSHTGFFSGGKKRCWYDWKLSQTGPTREELLVGHLKRLNLKMTLQFASTSDRTSDRVCLDPDARTPTHTHFLSQIIMPGYCVAGTVGHKILNGQRRIEFENKKVVSVGADR